MISLFANCSTANRRKEKKRKKKEWRHTARCRECVKRRVYLDYCQASRFCFLVYWSNLTLLLKAKQKVRFSHLFRFSDFILRLASKKNLHLRIRWWCDWFGIACANRCMLLLFFVTTPYLACAHVCRRFVFYPCPRDAAQGAGHSLI